MNANPYEPPKARLIHHNETANLFQAWRLFYVSFVVYLGIVSLMFFASIALSDMLITTFDLVIRYCLFVIPATLLCAGLQVFGHWLEAPIIE